jgi:hypothetical protein
MAIGRIPEPGTGIPESIVDAKGDIITATGSDTPARLAVGTNNQTLIAASGEATGLKYANGSVATLTAKGDLLTATAANTISRLAVGANGTTLVADSAEATGLKWAAASAGSTYAVFNDTKSPAGTTSGTFTSGAWRTRDLNTSQVNSISGASLASNQITLPAGTYYIDAYAGCFWVNQNQARLQNITDSTTAILGVGAYTVTAGNAFSFVQGVITIASTKVFELQHQCTVTRATDGFGTALNFNTEVYASIAIQKI